LTGFLRGQPINHGTRHDRSFCPVETCSPPVAEVYTEPSAKNSPREVPAVSIRRYRKPSVVPWWAKPWLILVIMPVLGFSFAMTGALTVAFGQPKPDTKPDSAAEVRKVLDAQAEAWNKGDLDGFMAGYWESEELRFASGGTVTTGFKATKERYAKRYKADGKEMGQLTFSEVTVEVVTADFAVVRGRWALKFENEKGEPSGLYTLTMKQIDGKWKVTTDHTSAADK
jgi:ketosteroid isomerase-like protein